MDGFLKLIGMGVFVVCLLGAVLIAALSPSLGIMTFVYAIPAMVGGAATYALGAILENIIAIRAAAERQAEAMSRMALEASNRQA